MNDYIRTEFEKVLKHVDVTDIGKDRNIIHMSDFYPENCTEQEIVEVNDNTLIELLKEKRYIMKIKKRADRHDCPKIYFDDEDYMGKLGVVSNEETSESDPEEILSNLLEGADITITKSCRKYRWR